MNYIYLAGPISGVTYDGATEWRERMAAALDTKETKTFSPMRGKEYLKAQGTLHSGTYDGTMTGAKAIMGRDFFDCTRSTVVVINLLNTKKVSIGTVMELAWCYQAQIPTIVLMEPGNIHDHVMANEACTYKVGSIEEAISVAKVLLNDL